MYSHIRLMGINKVCYLNVYNKNFSLINVKVLVKVEKQKDFIEDTYQIKITHF